MSVEHSMRFVIPVQNHTYFKTFGQELGYERKISEKSIRWKQSDRLKFKYSFGLKKVQLNLSYLNKNKKKTITFERMHLRS